MTDELYHYGIKGMKWGIRRTPAQLGHKTGSKKSGEGLAKKLGNKAAATIKNKRAASKEKKLRKKKISEMTDDELRQRISRLEMEKRYQDLVTSTTPKKGEDFVVRALKSAGESSLKNLAEQAFDTAGGEAINRIAAAFTGYEPNDPQHRVVNPRKRQSAKK